jgi:hypothetical protein
LVAAIPIWNHPEFEGIWAGIGALASAAQSGLLQVIFAPKATMEPYYADIGGTIFRLEYPNQESVGGHFPKNWQDYVVGMFVDMGAAMTAGVIVILVVLLFVGGEAAMKKRREIFW